MAQTYRQQHLRVMRNNEHGMSALFERLHGSIAQVLVRNADVDGIISPSQSNALRNEVSGMVTAAFVGGALGTQPAPFTTDRGRVVPQSDYMRVLWPSLEQATKIAVEQQAAIMRRNLRNAPDIEAAFMTARRSPFVVARRQLREQTDWRPREFLHYDPLHRFVDPNGYTLSARIWDTAQQTRRKLDLFLADGIANGKGARKLAVDLEQFLFPGRRLAQTRKPYGTTASYDAMRLARTEITAAAGRAGRMAAHVNPFVVGADWVRSSYSSACGVCDDLAAGSPYPLDKLPDLPGDSHPHCMCYYRWHTEGAGNIIDELRAELPAAGLPMADGLPSVLAIVTPLLADRFTQCLLEDSEIEQEAV